MAMDISEHFWQDRRVLVTGATGLVGSWLVERLIGLQADIVCLVRDAVPQSRFHRCRMHERVTCVHGDLADAACMERTLGEYEIRTVFHLAAQTIVPIANRNPLSTFQSNIAGTWTLLEAARRSPVIEQVIIASSDKAYGTQASLPYTETAALQGRHPYDVSKSCADLIAQAYAATWNLPVVITRCGNFFGGGDLNWNRIVPGTIRSILRGQRPVIRSDGEFIRDYFYVEDGAAAYLHLAECFADMPALAGQAFNFSSEHPISVLELVEEILQQMQSDLSPEIRGEASHEIRQQYLSAAKARRVLGWQPMFTLHEALERTIAWYREMIMSTATPWMSTAAHADIFR